MQPQFEDSMVSLDIEVVDRDYLVDQFLSDDLLDNCSFLIPRTETWGEDDWYEDVNGFIFI